MRDIIRGDMKVVAVGSGPASLLFGLALKKLRETAEVTILRAPVLSSTPAGIAFSGLLRRHAAGRMGRLLGQNLPLKHWRQIRIFQRNAEINLPAWSGAMGLAELNGVLEAAALKAGCKVRGLNRSVAEEDLEGFDLAALEASTASPLLEGFLSPRAPTKAKAITFTSSGLAADQAFDLAEADGECFFGHGFVFSAKQAVFSVEAGEKAWASTGLANGDTAALTNFVSKAFARALGGAILEPGGSLQSACGTAPAQWRHGTRVLLGGAEHAIYDAFHFRGELALDDALELAAAVSEASDLQAALKRYEMNRRRVALSAERTSAVMANWSENLHRYVDFAPLQFSFSMLTRSFRINHRDLQRVVPQYIKDVDRDFARAPADIDKAPPPMFVPFTLRGLTLPNRIGFSPMCMYIANDGAPDDFHLVHIGSRAMGGAGLVFTEMTNVSSEGRCTPACTGMYKRSHVDAWRRVVDYVHRYTSSKIAIQLGHAGRRASTARPWEGGPNIPALQDPWETIGPSALPYADTLALPREMTAKDMRKVIDDYVRAANWSVEAGFDLLEIHMAHGYLFSTFLSPLSNHRRDEFGGTLEKRSRFPLEVARAVRSAWPADRPLSVRISAIDWSADGSTIEQMIAFCHMLKEVGVDIIDVSTGNVINVRRPATGRLFQTPFSDQIRNEVKIPTMTVGRIASYGDINAILAAGRADICLLAKGHLDDPYFTRHAAKALGHLELKWPEPYATAASFLLRAET